ncbi:nitroreductase family deazaflavin-dependent oxidoreductase [Micromonospora sp. U21]|uniref:nitroreductase family deazaflavin-dependent oxidoreductase n=1 Tax=Micromonospora sp. U21 TaxID=2824899 RepID=UPI001B36DF64|nr:nitroreductase family deazaflavin-dependent oxidoreductase [Micromonospora sp. U21]MBQ0900463.1 nitroreductase family deazaflavin-dependent oxidoreductase [Micromonospora sp. U21]
MTSSEQVVDSPEGWVAEHIQRYVETGGAEGHEWRPGVYTLLLTTRGRHSGKRRRTALIYGRDGDDHLVVGSQGGAPKHPAWVLNLLAEPQVEVQVGPETFPARARVARPEEKPRMWSTMAAIWPAYDDYQARTDREIPVVVLERI